MAREISLKKRLAVFGGAAVISIVGWAACFLGGISHGLEVDQTGSFFCENSSYQLSSRAQCFMAVGNMDILLIEKQGTGKIANTETNRFISQISVFSSAQITGLTLPDDHIVIEPEETYQLFPAALPEGVALPSVIYQSSNEQVAKVQPSGTVVGVSGGTSIVTVTTADGRFTAQCMVKVLQEESSEFSWLIIVIEGLVLLGGLFCFIISYRRFLKVKMKKELHQLKKEPPKNG